MLSIRLPLLALALAFALSLGSTLNAAVSTNGNQTVALSANVTLSGTVPSGHGAQWSLVSAPHFAALNFAYGQYGSTSIPQANAIGYVSHTGTYVLRFTDTTDSSTADVTITVVNNSPGDGTVSKSRQVRIWPLGDSITFGSGNDNGGGYRFMLQDKLRTGGYQYDFVGGRHLAYDGNYDVDHEGHSGWQTVQYPSSQEFAWGFDDGGSGSGGYIIDTAGIQADLVLLMLGTNDGGMSNDSGTVACGHLFSNVVSDIWAKVPAARIIVAKIPPFNHRAVPITGYATNDAWVQEYNSQIDVTAAGLQAQGKKISVVDMYAVITLADLGDNVHPNPGGYTKMAQVWYDGIVAVTTGSGGGGNQAPSVSLATPTGPFTAPATISLNATASDSDGSVAKVEFFNGATKLGEDSSSPYSFSWTGVAAGTFSLTAKATDNLGATTTSTTVSVTVNAAANQVTTPAFSPAAGTYGGAQSVTINCSTTGAAIYYTTDGSTPTAASQAYGGAIAVTATTTIMAIATKVGMSDSAVASAIFTIGPPAGQSAAAGDTAGHGSGCGLGSGVVGLAGFMLLGLRLMLCRRRQEGRLGGVC